jgi:glycosyltransferase involved in cell wall biosynthesis
MSRNPLVSIVMPAFNAGLYAGEAIKSILSQTLTDFELIIINDGSTDNTAQVLTEYQAGDARLHVLHQRNCGGAASMNRGCALAKGKYIARMDSDDLCEPGRLARQVEYLEKHSDIGLCGTWMVAFQGEKETLHQYPSEPDIAKSMLPFQLSVAGPSIAFRRDTYLRIPVRNSPDVGATDDYLFVVECSKYFRFASVPEPLYRYRIHPEQVTNRESERQHKFTRQIRLKQLEELGLKPHGDELDLHEAISDWRLFGGEELIEKAHDWLNKLKRANALQPLYPEPAFSLVLRNYWFSLCLRHSRLGAWIYQRFSESPLTKGTRVRLGDRLKLLAKCVFDRSSVQKLRTSSDH